MVTTNTKIKIWKCDLCKKKTNYIHCVSISLYFYPKRIEKSICRECSEKYELILKNFFGE